MQFTYNGYKELINLLKEHNYNVANYHNWQNFSRCIIMRHDIDNDIEKSCKLAEIEAELGIKSTYFVLVTSDFYNIFSKASAEGLSHIKELGHEIGLHFDEKRYSQAFGKPELIKEKILSEAQLLGQSINQPITTVSMHRPSKEILESNLEIPGMINSYGQVYFKDFKYLSDSRRCWREPVEDIIRAEIFERVHILTHAFWYNETEKDIHDTLLDFLKSGNEARWITGKDNLTDIETIILHREIYI